ncbi:MULTISPECIES: DUF1206 domain-containing protein [Microbacterium]|uniref:DUF1206 domain-containing protein n=1 Tax=Microbacterium wangchenii TaxID=2541726 RepID=A0ABX5SST0_9MICO|nr:MULTISPECIES: DUF1206 domain-containing protein [Microbacterium]MCK6066969.1 DUF1206 domain-containing protein [Microbacterium sp. EYE_512]QBR88266.1 DUF1206 domain-containing protein [Microbacterium wangchenii]TFV83613.1 DUF1206 domain-containing protein [Microbacterium sp. dk485]TXK17944.1 DUF1206 domain-containing protein [Microbacterium wangchenii]
MRSEVRSAARSAEHNPVLRVLARAGYVANGIMHALIGVIVLVAASGGPGDADQTGAFRSIAAAPWGFALLWALAIGLIALGVWHAVAAVGARRAKRTQRVGILASEIGQAVVFAAVGAVAASVALGARPSAERAAEDASAGVLAMPAGPFLLGAVGLGVAIAGVAFVVMGVRRSFRTKVELPHNGWGHAVAGLGVVGFVAKGIALIIVGILLAVAAVEVDPGQAGGLDGAVQALLQLPAGPLLGAAVGVGFLAYGAFTILRARFAKLSV